MKMIYNLLRRLKQYIYRRRAERYAKRVERLKRQYYQSYKYLDALKHYRQHLDNMKGGRDE